MRLNVIKSLLNSQTALLSTIHYLLKSLHIRILQFAYLQTNAFKSMHDSMLLKVAFQIHKQHAVQYTHAFSEIYI